MIFLKSTVTFPVIDRLRHSHFFHFHHNTVISFRFNSGIFGMSTENSRPKIEKKLYAPNLICVVFQVFLSKLFSALSESF